MVASEPFGFLDWRAVIDESPSFDEMKFLEKIIDYNYLDDAGNEYCDRYAEWRMLKTYIRIKLRWHKENLAFCLLEAIAMRSGELPIFGDEFIDGRTETYGQDDCPD